jgi:hypothetical protein
MLVSAQSAQLGLPARRVQQVIIKVYSKQALLSFWILVFAVQISKLFEILKN